MKKRRWKLSWDTKLERNAALHMSKERSGTRKKYVDQCASSLGTFIPTNYQTCSYLYPCDAAVPCCSVGSSDVAESFQSICLRSLHSICSGCARWGAAMAATYCWMLLLLLLLGTECPPCLEEAVNKNPTHLERSKEQQQHRGLPAVLNLKHSNHKHSC